MKKTKRLSAILLAITIVISLLAAMPLTASAKKITTANVNDAASLEKALRDENVKVINITDSFTYNNTVLIKDENRKVDVNLNGHTLNVVSEGAGIELRKESRLSVNGSGVLNVSSETDGISSKSSVFTTTGAVTVNVAVNGSTVRAVNAEDRGMVTFTGSASANGSYYSAGVYASQYSSVKITGDVSATGSNVIYGVHANWQCTISITGNVTASGTNCAAVYAASDGTLDIFGNASASGAGSIGAYVEDKGKIFITGSVSGDASQIRVQKKDMSTTYPTKTGVRFSRPRDGYAWAEFKSGEGYVYLPQGGVSIVPELQWRNVNGEWYCYNPDGSTVKDQWVQSGGQWYYLKHDAAMAKNQWIAIDGVHYYFEKSGAMATGWHKNDGDWIFFNPDGTRLSGWIQLDGAWYHFDGKGEADKGGKWIDGVNYYFHPNGAMAIGWVNDNNTWYYYKADGAQSISETITIDGKDYTFNAFGICTNP